MTETLCDAVRVYTRYHTPGTEEETRAERNYRFGQPVPDYFIPEEGFHLWEIFWQVINSTDRIIQGQALSFNLVELNSFNFLLYPEEKNILLAMSRIWSETTQTEINYQWQISQKSHSK